MSNLIDHARRELEIAGLFGTDSDYGGLLGPAVLKMVEAFDDEGHSGNSARLALDIFKKVASFEPLTPLTGAESEWNEFAPGMWQNNRCSHVFKDADGVPYDIRGRIFEDPDGCRYTSGESRVPIIFPYTPKIEIVKRTA